MQASLEISLYPLTEKYEEKVIDFILKMKSYPELEIETNGISTQVFGNYDDLMKMLTSEMKDWLEENNGIFVLKIAGGSLKQENLPKSLIG